MSPAAAGGGGRPLAGQPRNRTSAVPGCARPTSALVGTAELRSARLRRTGAGCGRRRACLQSLARLALALGCAVACSCSIGSGSGVVRGSLQVGGCTFDSSGNPFPLAHQNPYDLKADFFVGEPIDSNPITAPGFPANQMIIRIQPSGARLEFADALQFWILDSAQAARCLRGAPADGALDPAICDRSPASLGPNGEGRLLVGMTSEMAFGSFVLNASCPNAYLSADALGSCADGSCPDVSLCPGRGSWMALSHFGSVPADPAQAISPSFRVNDGERITASAFHVELCDRATVEARLESMIPDPKPLITGTLDGNFDFDLQRGQAGQAFP